MLTPEQKSLIHHSFRKIALRGDTVAELFYSRLFIAAPEVRPLFKSDMREQYRKFMQTVGTLVAALEDTGKLETALHQLGERHVTYGVQRDHYAVVGEALLWAMAHSLGTDFTPDVESAWSALYSQMSQIAASADGEQ